MGHRGLVVGGLMIALLGLAPGCASVQQILHDTPTPSASLQRVSLSKLSLDTVGLAFEIEVRNPYPVELPLLDLSYSLASGGEAFTHGTSTVGGTVPASGSRTITLPLDLVPGELLRTLSSIRPGQVIPYRAQLTLGVDPPALAPLELPLSHEGELPLPAAPQLSLASVQWDELSLNSASGSVALDLSNPNEFDFALLGLSTALKLGGRGVADLATQEVVEWPAGQTQRIELPLRISPTDLGVSVLQMLTSSGASYALDGSMRVDTRFGALELPLRASGQTDFLR